MRKRAWRNLSAAPLPSIFKGTSGREAGDETLVWNRQGVFSRHYLPHRLLPKRQRAARKLALDIGECGAKALARAAKPERPRQVNYPASRQSELRGVDRAFAAGSSGKRQNRYR